MGRPYQSSRSQREKLWFWREPVRKVKTHLSNTEDLRPEKQTPCFRRRTQNQTWASRSHHPARTPRALPTRTTTTEATGIPTRMGALTIPLPAAARAPSIPVARRGTRRGMARLMAHAMPCERSCSSAVRCMRKRFHATLGIFTVLALGTHAHLLTSWMYAFQY